MNIRILSLGLLIGAVGGVNCMDEENNKLLPLKDESTMSNQMMYCIECSHCNQEVKSVGYSQLFGKLKSHVKSSHNIKLLCNKKKQINEIKERIRLISMYPKKGLIARVQSHKEGLIASVQSHNKINHRAHSRRSIETFFYDLRDRQWRIDWEMDNDPH